MRPLSLAYYHLTKGLTPRRRADYSRFNTPAKFDRLYRLDGDPFGVERTAYEQRKAQDLLAMIGDTSCSHVLDIGCGTGRLTKLLAVRHRRITAIDFSEQAIARAKRYCKAHSNIRFVHADISTVNGAEHYDLIVCSEVLYYLDDSSLIRAVQYIGAMSSAGARVVSVTRLDDERTRIRLTQEFGEPVERRVSDVVRPYVVSVYTRSV